MIDLGAGHDERMTRTERIDRKERDAQVIPPDEMGR